MQYKWFVIINPTSGNGSSKQKWPVINNELNEQNFNFEFAFTEHKNHAIELVKNAINKGFTNIISVGGDGTLHSIVNGILSLNPSNIGVINIGIIPVGTGNDWVKTYNISKKIKKSIAIIKAQHTIKQDIGKITLENTKQVFYFNNLAGIGFDGYVVNKVYKFKNLGFLAYLTGALVSLTSYKKPSLKISFNDKILKGETLMFLMGICKYSGGGMQLTETVNSTDGLFDVSFVKNITLFQILSNLRGLFNGNVTKLSVVENYKASNLKIEVTDNTETFIQADGELIGSGSFNVSILPKSLNFVVPK